MWLFQKIQYQRGGDFRVLGVVQNPKLLNPISPMGPKPSKVSKLRFLGFRLQGLGVAAEGGGAYLLRHLDRFSDFCACSLKVLKGFGMGAGILSSGVLGFTHRLRSSSVLWFTFRIL